MGIAYISLLARARVNECRGGKQAKRVVGKILQARAVL